MYEDRTLSCMECNQSFTFSADDQAYHAEKGYTNEPKRCPACRQAKRAQRNGDSFAAAAAGMIEALGKCTRSSAPNAAKTPLCLSGLGATARSTAATASDDRARRLPPADTRIPV